MNNFFLIFFIFFTTTTFAQRGNTALIAEYEDTLKIISKKIMTDELEKDRRVANNAFITHLDEVLKFEKSFEYPFDSLQTVSVITSPDNEFRIYTWMLRKRNGTYEYFGRVQLKKKNRIKIFNLNDSSKNIRNPEIKELDNNNWFGGIIYDIIYNKSSKGKYYTLLIWDGNDHYSTKKIIDVMQFSADKIIFGKSIFKVKESKTKRIILEYNGKTSISLQYDEDNKRIVFDHLVPSNTQLEGLYEYYIPDGTFDAFNFEKGSWFFNKDIDIRNNQKVIEYKKPKTDLIPQ